MAEELCAVEVTPDEGEPYLNNMAPFNKPESYATKDKKAAIRDCWMCNAYKHDQAGNHIKSARVVRVRLEVVNG